MLHRLLFTNTFELCIKQKSKDFFIKFKLLKPILKWCKILIYNVEEVGVCKIIFQRLTSFGILSYILNKLLLSTNNSLFLANTGYVPTSCARSLAYFIKSLKPHSLSFSNNKMSSFIFVIVSISISSCWKTLLTRLTLSKILHIINYIKLKLHLIHT